MRRYKYAVVSRRNVSLDALLLWIQLWAALIDDVVGIVTLTHVVPTLEITVSRFRIMRLAAQDKED